MDSEIIARMQRIYAALDATIEGDLANIPPIVEKTEGAVTVWQDFTGGLSDAQLSNLAFSLIDNIAHLRDYARRACKKAGIDPDEADKIAGEPPLPTIIDLSNRNKHGGPPRDGGWSGKSPQIKDVTRLQRTRVRGDRGSRVAVNLLTSEVSGDGEVEVIVTADVVNSDGARIGDLHDLCTSAVGVWESELKALGLAP